MQHGDTKFWACALLTCAWVVAAADSAAPFAIDSLAATTMIAAAAAGAYSTYMAWCSSHSIEKDIQEGNERVLKHRIDRPTD